MNKYLKIGLIALAVAVSVIVYFKFFNKKSATIEPVAEPTQPTEVVIATPEVTPTSSSSPDTTQVVAVDTTTTPALPDTTTKTTTLAIGNTPIASVTNQQITTAPATQTSPVANTTKRSAIVYATPAKGQIVIDSVNQAIVFRKSDAKLLVQVPEQFKDYALVEKPR